MEYEADSPASRSSVDCVAFSSVVLASHSVVGLGVGTLAEIEMVSKTNKDRSSDIDRGTAAKRNKTEMTMIATLDSPLSSSNFTEISFDLSFA